MIKIINRKLCCGCQACVQACSKGCISFEEKADGFSYPIVDESKCIDCHLCEKVCPIIQNSLFDEKCSVIDYKSFAAITKDEDSLSKSSSGGIFLEISKRCFFVRYKFYI